MTRGRAPPNREDVSVVVVAPVVEGAFPTVERHMNRITWNEDMYHELVWNWKSNLTKLISMKKLFYFAPYSRKS